MLLAPASGGSLEKPAVDVDCSIESIRTRDADLHPEPSTTPSLPASMSRALRKTTSTTKTADQKRSVHPQEHIISDGEDDEASNQMFIGLHNAVFGNSEDDDDRDEDDNEAEDEPCNINDDEEDDDDDDDDDDPEDEDEHGAEAARQYRDRCALEAHASSANGGMSRLMKLLGSAAQPGRLECA